MKNFIINIKEENLEKFSYKNNDSTGGNQLERENWEQLKELFPNLEIFWRYFVVPMTKRVKIEISDCNPGKLDYRDEVNKKIKEMGIIAHLIFYQLILAKNHLQFYHYYSFQYFYIHLNTICDLINKFIQKINSLLNIDNNNKYFIGKDDKEYNELNDFEKLIGKYRNAIVHHSNIHPINFYGKAFVPKKDKIDGYILKIYSSSEMSKLNQNDINDDFIEVKDIASNDLKIICNIMNKIFDKIIKKMKELIYIDKNNILLKMYKIKIIGK